MAGSNGFIDGKGQSVFNGEGVIMTIEVNILTGQVNTKQKTRRAKISILYGIKK